MKKLDWIFPQVLALVFLILAARGDAAEVTTLGPDNWEKLVPSGKEVDAIYGDHTLTNDHVVAVIAKAIETRNANMTVRGVGGSVIDLTSRQAPSDQLSAFYPAPGYDLGLLSSKTGNPAQLRFMAPAVDGRPSIEIVYRIADGLPWLEIETIYRNPHEESIEIQLQDAFRLDGEYKTGVDEELNLFWGYDFYWKQAYGVFAPEHSVGLQRVEGSSRPVIAYSADGESARSLGSGQEYSLKRYLIPAADLLGVKAFASQIAGKSELHELLVTVSDQQGVIENAEIAFHQGDNLVGRCLTDADGRWRGDLSTGEYTVHVITQGREKVEQQIDVGGNQDVAFTLSMPGFARGKVVDGSGSAIPAKIIFQGLDGTDDPYFGPDSAVHGVRNVWYTADGNFKVPLLPGRYRALISHGNEFDADVQEFRVERGQEIVVDATLKRAVNTEGWLSTEYHSHSSPSGDNTSEQRGRVLNLLAEHIEFAPCTEHNRIDTYVPHLKHFNAMKRMLTCSGMELTGSPLPLNHQNAFPLKRYPRTQDGGAPVTDTNPIVQIARLAMWDENSEKLVQINHPNIPQILGDRDWDGQPDAGFEKMLGFMDVIEIHPPASILTPPTSLPASERDRGNRMFNWMQLHNLGYRLPGVVNTDAHWNFHGSGWLRNYVRSSTDDPSQAGVMELVHASEHGQIVMTNGPFLEVVAKEGEQTAGVGGDLKVSSPQVAVRIRVECPNWFSINRVQIFANGRPLADHDYRANTHPQMFKSGAVKYEETVTVPLEEDTHIIVAAAGEGLKLGPIVGPAHADDIPIAVTNPIFIDVDGEGFQANGDMLDVPLVMPTDLVPSHGHDHHAAEHAAHD